MNCQDMPKLVNAYHDRELDAASTLQVEDHLAQCPSCAGARRSVAALSETLQDAGLRYRAPDSLRQSLRAAIGVAADSEREAPRSPSRWFAYSGWVAAVAILALSLLTPWRPALTGRDPLVADLADSHIRSLMAAHLTDVESTDQHTVKPWFDGKLPFAPPVRELRASGFPLLGGRLEFVAGHPAAALVYGRQKHVINLLIWPSAPAAPVVSAAPRTFQQDGYNVVLWSEGGMTCGAVSDLNQAEMLVFAGEFSKTR